MKNLISLIAATFLVLACCASLTVTAATPPAAKDLVMSFNESFTSGAISERGTRHEDFSVISVNSDGSQVVVAGTSTITTASGTISTKFTGTIYFDNATFGSTHLAYVEGTESVTGGTGAYAAVVGKPGTFAATIDYVANAGIGVFEAKVQLSQ